VDQDQKPRQRSFISELVPDWRPSEDQVLWTVRGVIALLVVLGILTLIGVPFDITLYDWLDLLIIPVVLAIGGYLFNSSQNRATGAAAEQRAQDEALQAYIDHMSQLLTDEKHPFHHASLGDASRAVARARTLTVLSRLNGPRRAQVVQFLNEAGLIGRDDQVLDLSKADLKDADLSSADLSGAYLARTDLTRANLTQATLRDANLVQATLSDANLARADLRGVLLFEAALIQAKLTLVDLAPSKEHANLRDAWLERADLSGARLHKTRLTNAHMRGANLSRAYLIETALGDADLSDADLRRANLRGAYLGGADLRGANLAHAKVLQEQLEKAESLEGATMPDGQKYEDWLKSKGSGAEGENDGTS
jgi:uncharacterized protein YjbI with pentapeptide repeats